MQSVNAYHIGDDKVNDLYHLDLIKHDKARENLRHIQCLGGYLVSSNGHQLHWCAAPKDLPTGRYISLAKSAKAMLLRVDDKAYGSLASAIEHHSNKAQDKPALGMVCFSSRDKFATHLGFASFIAAQANIPFNADYLKQAMQGLARSPKGKASQTITIKGADIKDGGWLYATNEQGRGAIIMGLRT